VLSKKADRLAADAHFVDGGTDDRNAARIEQTRKFRCSLRNFAEVSFHLDGGRSTNFAMLR
jgi:hypothetical protein